MVGKKSEAFPSACASALDTIGTKIFIAFLNGAARLVSLFYLFLLVLNSQSRGLFSPAGKQLASPNLVCVWAGREKQVWSLNRLLTPTCITIHSQHLSSLFSILCFASALRVFGHLFSVIELGCVFIMQLSRWRFLLSWDVFTLTACTSPPAFSFVHCLLTVVVMGKCQSYFFGR